MYSTDYVPQKEVFLKKTALLANFSYFLPANRWAPNDFHITSFTHGLTRTVQSWCSSSRVYQQVTQCLQRRWFQGRHSQRPHCYFSAAPPCSYGKWVIASWYEADVINSKSWKNLLRRHLQPFCQFVLPQHISRPSRFYKLWIIQLSKMNWGINIIPLCFLGELGSCWQQSNSGFFQLCDLVSSARSKVTVDSGWSWNIGDGENHHRFGTRQWIFLLHIRCEFQAREWH